MNEDPAPKFSIFVNIGAINWNPDECTRAVGIQPTCVWHQPDHMVQGGKRRSEWSYGFDTRSFYSLDEAVSALFDEVWDYRNEVRRFANMVGFDLSITCTVTILKDRPEYTFGPDVLKKLAWLGCEFVLDIFDYSEHEGDGVLHQPDF